MSEIVSERVISVIEAPKIVIETAAPAEVELKEQTSELELMAEVMPVTTDKEYEDAAEFGRMLKTKAVEVAEFFKPMKDAAHKAHKEICDREKTMLTPLSNAEKLVKQAMGAFVTKKDAERRKTEEAARRAAEAEAARCLAEAVSLEEQGKKDEAEAIIGDAELFDTVASTLSVSASTPKVSGVTTKRDWEIVGIVEDKVPVSIAGVEIRLVDKAAVLRLIRASKGSVQIPGVIYRETTNMSFNRR